MDGIGSLLFISWLVGFIGGISVYHLASNIGRQRELEKLNIGENITVINCLGHSEPKTVYQDRGGKFVLGAGNSKFYLESSHGLKPEATLQGDPMTWLTHDNTVLHS